MKDNHLIIEITDDGVGRLFHQTANQDSHKSSGMDLTSERIELFAKDYGGQSTFDIIDLYENEMAIGTKIRIVIPYIELKNDVKSHYN